MPTPKSQIKIDKNGVTYESNVDACEYYLFELTRGALRDVAKFVRREFKDSYYSHFTKRTGNAGKACSAKVWSGKNTKYPRVDIGLKQGKVDGFYAFFQEFGTSNGIPKLGLLQRAVQDNIDEIIRIESQYLTALETNPEDEIDEEEMDIEEGDE